MIFVKGLQECRQARSNPYFYDTVRKEDGHVYENKFFNDELLRCGQGK